MIWGNTEAEITTHNKTPSEHLDHYKFEAMIKAAVSPCKSQLTNTALSFSEYENPWQIASQPSNGTANGTRLYKADRNSQLAH